jgi:DegV family protein with EDD domain
MNLTHENTAVVLDSTADFPDAQIRFPNMRVVPLYVRFGEESFRDYVELDPHGFYERLRAAAELPTTSQPTPQDFMSTYNALSSYERIYSLHISSKLSGTFQSASLAASEIGGDRIRLIDTESASVGIGMLAIAIQELLSRGTTDEEIEALAALHRERAGILFTVDTLEFLAKGGRIGRARALMGNLLNVKPILAIEDGEVVPVTRVRGRAKAFEEFRRRFEAATTDGPGLGIGIAHAEAEEAVEQLEAIVLATRPEAEVKLVTSLGAVVGTHAGPGTVGFFWFQPGSSSLAGPAAILDR